MKTKAILFLSSASFLHAGTADLETTLPAKPTPWIKPTVDIRARYEFGDTDGKGVSHAFTFRERLGLKTQAWNGFSAFIEGEFSQAAVDDYHGGAIGADPFDPANTLIADPETNELNQGYVQYEGFDTTFKLGRQRIVYDNSAFIGDVIWRQNQQTYDAFSIVNKSIDGLTFNYAYVSGVNRIFGSNATNLPNVADLSSSLHLLNGSYTGIKGLTLGGYAYIMNFEDIGSWDNNTFGVSAKGNLLGLTLYGELAFQGKAGVFGEDEALYGHATVTKAFGTQSVTLGMEYLEAGFKTPLATLHAFNGFADVFVAGRTNGSHNGVADLYVSHTIPIFYGIKWMNALHAYGDNNISADYGWEYNSVLVKKFDDNFTAIAKFAQFESEGDVFSGKSALPTTSRFSIEMNYTF